MLCDLLGCVRVGSNLQLLAQVLKNWWCCCCRSISNVWSYEQPIGQFRIGTDSAVAVPAGAAVRLVERGVHHVGGHQRRVQTHRPRRGGPPLGRTKIKTQHELRQTQSSTQVTVAINRWLTPPPSIRHPTAWLNPVCKYASGLSIRPDYPGLSKQQTIAFPFFPARGGHVGVRPWHEKLPTKSYLNKHYDK